jgi:hypothetical protein
MLHAAMGTARRDADIKRLDDLLAELRRTQPFDDLLVEHLSSARNYLMGAMPEEYALALEEGRQATDLVTNATVRETAQQTIASLLDEFNQTQPQPEAPRHRPADTDTDAEPRALTGTETELFTFFKGRKTSLGVFYPWRYIIATFDSFEAAEMGAAALHEDGFGPDEVLAAPGQEMLKFFDELRADNGLFGTVMEELSKVIATEAAFVEADTRRAKRGAGFLAVYAPDEQVMQRVRELAAPFNPISMHWYKAGGIESLI